jgi:hypothetical protein
MDKYLSSSDLLDDLIQNNEHCNQWKIKIVENNVSIWNTVCVLISASGCMMWNSIPERANAILETS